MSCLLEVVLYILIIHYIVDIGQYLLYNRSTLRVFLFGEREDEDTRRWINVGSVLGRRWPSTYPALGRCLVFAGNTLDTLYLVQETK